MHSDGLLLVVLFLFLLPLILLSLLFLAPCVRRRRHTGWIVAGVFFPLTQSVPLTDDLADDDGDVEKKQHKPQHQPPQKPNELHLDSEELQHQTSPLLNGPGQPQQEQHHQKQQRRGCCGWRAPPKSVTAFRLRDRRFRLAATTSTAWTTTALNFAACVVVAAGCFGFGRVWLFDSDQKSEILPSRLPGWTCTGKTPISSRALSASPLRSCDVAALRSAAAAEVRGRDWAEFKAGCPKVLAENLFYACKMTSADQMPSRRKRQSSSSSSSSFHTARFCCSIFADGCWVPSAAAPTARPSQTGRCLSGRLCDACSFDHCVCPKMVAEAAKADCGGRRAAPPPPLQSPDVVGCGEADVADAVEGAMREIFVGQRFADSVTRSSCIGGGQRGRADDTTDDQTADATADVGAIFRRVARVGNASIETRGGDECDGFCHRWYPNWNDALVGVVVALGLHLGFALLFQFTVVTVISLFLSPLPSNSDLVFRRRGKGFPLVRKFLLPVLVLLVASLVAALHLTTCGIDGIVAAQDLVFVFCFIVVVLAGILLPWEDARGLPSCGCRHICRVESVARRDGEKWKKEKKEEEEEKEEIVAEERGEREREEEDRGEREGEEKDKKKEKGKEESEEREKGKEGEGGEEEKKKENGGKENEKGEKEKGGNGKENRGIEEEKIKRKENEEDKREEKKEKGNGEKNGEGEKERSNEVKEKIDERKERGDGEKEKIHERKERGDGEKKKIDKGKERGDGEKKKIDEGKERGDGEKKKIDEGKERGDGEKEKIDEEKNKNNGGKDNVEEGKENGDGGKDRGDVEKKKESDGNETKPDGAPPPPPPPPREKEFSVTEAEDDYYRRCFKICDVNDSGHITATELRNALVWINDHPFAERVARDFNPQDILTWETFKEVDRDGSLTLEMEEFVDLMKREKIVFAKMLFEAADVERTGELMKEEVYSALRKAGFVYNGSWDQFLLRFDIDGDGKIDYTEFLGALKSL